MSGEPRVHDDELARFLCERMSLDQVIVFYERFGGYRIAKRSQHVTHQRNIRVLVACLIRTVGPATTLSEEACKAVGAEFGLSPKAVRNTWHSWNRTGRPRVKKQGTAAASAPDTFRW